jgi:hypothetical protein
MPTGRHSSRRLQLEQATLKGSSRSAGVVGCIMIRSVRKLDFQQVPDLPQGAISLFADVASTRLR